jgi:SHR-binding domain of vacuolar-sorting associated protein 13
MPLTHLFQEVDILGSTEEGWESSPTSSGFASNRVFNASHCFRRRRWTRTRRGLQNDALLDGVAAYYHPIQQSPLIRDEGNIDKNCTKMALQIDGSRWSLTPELPEEGTIFGAMRVLKTTWNTVDGTEKINCIPASSIFELCYSLQPLEGEWGLYSRTFIVSSRFMLRNNSTVVDYEIKQIGCPDSTAISLTTGGTCSFHWYDTRMPELISIRPVAACDQQNIYKWSGGFDPLTIGSVPVRVRQRKHSRLTDATQYQYRIRSIKLETEIRTRTGGTGITISFMEEDEKGVVALFRIENQTTLPLWFGQDGILANPSMETYDAERDGDILPALSRSVFALDVPYRQGKYSHRKDATMSELLRVRVALAPLSSREGIETMKVVALTTLNEQVRLNPSRLQVLPFDLRSKLEHVRLLGTVANDGPTRVLVFR